MSNNTFTEENTGSATHLKFRHGDLIFMNEIEKTFLSIHHARWVGWHFGIENDAIELSRPIGEHKEDFLIPIDYVKKFTTLVVGDKWATDTQSGVIDESDVDLFNGQNRNESLCITSFADRPNTGKQPVGGDVVVDVYYKSKWHTGSACFYVWSFDDNAADITKWKPNHSALLKQYQAEQALKEVVVHNKQEVTGDTSHLSIDLETEKPEITPTDALKKLIYACDGLSQEYREENYGGAKNWMRHVDSAYRDYEDVEGEQVTSNEPETPVFTQEMKDAGELPPVGSECLIMFSSSNYRGVITYVGDGVGCYYSKDNDREYTFALNSVKFKAIRTDKEKLRDAIEFATGLRPRDGLNEVVGNLLSSDKFTITLND